MNELRRTRSGEILCNQHATSGAPGFHTDGCVRCEEARAKGIIRPEKPSGLTSGQLGRLVQERLGMTAFRRQPGGRNARIKNISLAKRRAAGY